MRIIHKNDSIRGDIRALTFIAEPIRPSVVKNHPKRHKEVTNNRTGDPNNILRHDSLVEEWLKNLQERQPLSELNYIIPIYIRIHQLHLWRWWDNYCEL